MPRQLRSALHHSHLFLLTAVVATTFVTSACAQVGKPPAPVSLTKILGGQDALWCATTPIKVDDPDYRVVEIDGQPAVVVGPNGLDLATAEPLTRDTEIRAVLQFTSPKDVGTKVHIYAGSKKINATDPDSPLATGLTIHPGPSYAQKLYWGTGRMPGQKEPPSGIYYSRNLPRDRLAWPELTRRRVEQEAGAEPMLEQRAGSPCVTSCARMLSKFISTIDCCAMAGIRRSTPQAISVCAFSTTCDWHRCVFASCRRKNRVSRPSLSPVT